jgi:hypothetical protein
MVKRLQLAYGAKIAGYELGVIMSELTLTFAKRSDP